MQKLLLIFRICSKRFTELIIAEGNEDKGGIFPISPCLFSREDTFPEKGERKMDRLIYVGTCPKFR
jgi:hypothetical protein